MSMIVSGCLSMSQCPIYTFKSRNTYPKVIIRHDALFDAKILAHEVGHILGAGHERLDPLDKNISG